jgi:hypothetical protein
LLWLVIMSIPPASPAPDYFSLVIDWGADLDDATPIAVEHERSATEPTTRVSRLRKIALALAAVGVLLVWIQRLRRHRHT